MNPSLMEDLLKQVTRSPFQVVAIGASLVALGYVCIKGAYGNEKTTNRHPPGPRGDLFIGNLRQFPKSRFSATFCNWAKQYGTMVYVTLPGVSIVILNSYEIAQELLSKRLNTTGGRNGGYMFTQIMNWGWVLSLKNPGTTHSNQRKMIRRGIGPQRLGSHNPFIESTAAKLMLDLCDFKGDPQPLVLNALGHLVHTVAYGTEIVKMMGNDLQSWNMEVMDMANSAMFAFWPVDYLPILRFVPSWFPGATFKRIGKRSTWLTEQLRHQPFEMAKELYNSGRLGHSIASDLLDEFGPVDDVRDALALLYVAGADTTTAAITTFIYSMFLFPETAQKVYEEIKSVTHGQRLPQVADRANLPFTEAAWKEAWRWHPFFPLGMPHVNSQDEIVDGMVIPKGSLININYEFMLTDPNVWGDPEVFRPERFLERDNLPNPMTVVFGYGLRVCPGMYLADRGGFHIAATTLALYEIVPLEGAKPQDPSTIKYTDTLFQLPIGFECRFIPRDEKVKDILKMISLNE